MHFLDILMVEQNYVLLRR